MDSLNLALHLRGASVIPANPIQHSGSPLTNGRAQCGNPQCSRGWLAFLKDRRRPILEGRWGCCSACVRALVDTAIRRELGEAGVRTHESEHRHRMPLGLIILAQGWITHPQLQHALNLQRQARSGRIGDWLIQECGLTQVHITRALSMQWGCPVLTLDGFDPEAMALAVPRLLIETLGFIPLRIAGKQILYLAFADELDASSAFAMEHISGMKVVSGLANSAEWAEARQRLSECDTVDATFEPVTNVASMSSKIASALAGMQPRASRLVRLHQFYWLRMWLETGAMSTHDGGVPVTKEDVADRIYTVATEQ